jgi:hypothetical protein
MLVDDYLKKPTLMIPWGAYLQIHEPKMKMLKSGLEKTRFKKKTQPSGFFGFFVFFGFLGCFGFFAQKRGF